MRPHELAHGLSELAQVTGIRVSGFEWEGRRSGYAGQSPNGKMEGNDGAYGAER